MLINQEFHSDSADTRSKANHSAIYAKAFSFSYSSSLEPVISISNWQVPAGEHIFLQGASGMGKSTLLQLLCGLHIGSGQLSVAGVELSELTPTKRDHFRAQNIGMVFQQFNLIPYLSGLDNVLLAASLAGRKGESSNELAQSLLNSTGLEPKVWRQRADTLSIGQQQRVAIARALINTPPILLFDEPTSALDEKNKNLFMQVLTQHLESHVGTTAIFVSHDTRLASYFEHSIELSNLSSDDVKGSGHHAN